MGQKYKIGEFRPSQLIHTFGIGAIIDFPNISAIVMGLEDWEAGKVRSPLNEIHEDRLINAIQSQLGPHIKYLYRPPSFEDEDAFKPEARTTGVPVSTFPRWVRCPLCGRMCDINDGVVRFRPDFFRTDKIHYEHANCQKGTPTMIPVRRLVACEKGHIDDFPWLYFVHGGKSDCRGPLFWRERGVTGNPEEILIECGGCDAKKSLLHAFGDRGKENLPKKCSGHHPHLRKTDEDCSGEPRPIVLGASNSWFSMTVSVITIPTGGSKLDDLVYEYWDKLKVAASMSPEAIKIFREQYDLTAFEKYSDDEIHEALKRRKREKQQATDGADNYKDVKLPEWKVFSSAEKLFKDRNINLISPENPMGYDNWIHSIKQVERMREVMALIGFTRLTSPGEFGEWDADTMELRAPISRTNQSWVPAIEVRGEGIFIQFREDTLIDWLNKPETQERGELFHRAHTENRRLKGIEPPEVQFPGMRYILLHSFSHALMRQLSLECGYSQASIRERIYARESGQAGGPMAGILIYTAAPDSEGTLGGLSSLANTDELQRNLDLMFEDLVLCSSDPHCAEHKPEEDGSSLHGSACHACLFSPETSCERGNKYLDRSLLVQTLSSSALTFF